MSPNAEAEEEEALDDLVGSSEEVTIAVAVTSLLLVIRETVSPVRSVGAGTDCGSVMVEKECSIAAALCWQGISDGKGRVASLGK